MNIPWDELEAAAGIIPRRPSLPRRPAPASRVRGKYDDAIDLMEATEGNLSLVDRTPTAQRLRGAGEDVQSLIRKRPKFWQKAWGHTEAGLSFFPRLFGNLAEGGAQAADVTRAWRAEGPTIGEVATRRMQPGWKKVVAGGALDIGLDPTTWVGIGAAKGVAGAGKTLAKEVGAASKVAREAVSSVKVGSKVSMKALGAAEEVAQAAAKTRELPMELIEKSLGTAADYDWLTDLSRKAIDEARVVPRTGVYAGLGKRQVELVSPEKLRKAKLAITEPVLGAIKKRPWLGAPLRMHAPAYIAEATGLGEAGARALTQTRRNLVHGMAAAESSVKRTRDILMKVEGMTAEEAKAIPLIHRWSDKEQLVADLAANRNLLEKTRKPLNRARLEATITEHERLLSNPLESLLPNYSTEKLAKLKAFATEKLPKIYEDIYLAEREPEALQAAMRAWKPPPGETKKYTLKWFEPVEREMRTPSTPLNLKQLLQRWEEPGVSPSLSKPHGLYLSPADIKSPHPEKGWGRFDFIPNFKKPLDVSEVVPTPIRYGATDSGAGVKALRVLDEELFYDLRSRPLSEVREVASKLMPKEDFSNYTDLQEVLESIGAELARKHGYDSLIHIDKKAPEFTEFVALTASAAKQVNISGLATPLIKKETKYSVQQPSRYQELSAALPELKAQVREQLLANRPGYRKGYLPGVSTMSSRVRGPQLGPAERFSDFKKSFSHPFDRAIAAKAARDYLETVGPQLSDAARSNLTAVVKTWDVEQDAVQALAGRTLNSVLTKLHKEAFADLRRFTLPAKAAAGKAGWTEAPWAELKGQWIPDEVRDALGRILRPKEVGVFKEKETAELVKHWQSAQQWLRGMFTGFPVTAGRWLTLNTIGLAWNGLLGGMKTEDVGHGIAVLLGRLPNELVRPALASLKLIPKHREAVEKILDKGINTLRHGKLDYRQVAAMAEKHGILRSFGAEENMLRRLKQRGPGHYLNVLNPNSPLFQAAFLANEMEDEAFKAGLMVRKLLEGQPAEEAANITHRFFPDYGELTPFEKHVRANYIPFMTWISRNFRIQLENTLKSPGKVGGFVKGKQAAEYGGQPYPQNLKPDWIKEMQGVRIPKKGQPEYFMPRLPVADLPQYLDPQNWAQTFNPFIVMMAEYAFHKDLFTGKPIASVKDLGKQALMKLPVTSLGGRIIQRPTEERGKYLFGQVTGLRKYSVDLTKMADVEKRRQQRALTARERELIKRGKLRKTKRQAAYPLQQRKNVLQYIPEEMLPTIEDSEE